MTNLRQQIKYRFSFGRGQEAFYLNNFCTQQKPNLKSIPPARTPPMPPAELAGGFLNPAGIEPLDRVQENLPLRMEAVPIWTDFPLETGENRPRCPDPQLSSQRVRGSLSVTNIPRLPTLRPVFHYRSFQGALVCLVSLRSPATSARRSV